MPGLPFLRLTSSLVTPRYDYLNTDYDHHGVRLADSDWYVFDIILFYIGLSKRSVFVSD